MYSDIGMVLGWQWSWATPGSNWAAKLKSSCSHRRACFCRMYRAHRHLPPGSQGEGEGEGAALKGEGASRIGWRLQSADLGQVM